MCAMAFTWGVILIGGITYFSIIGTTPPGKRAS